MDFYIACMEASPGNLDCVAVLEAAQANAVAGQALRASDEAAKNKTPDKPQGRKHETAT